MVHIQELEKYAKENNIPIMETDGIEFLLTYIKENNIKNILEIGAAIGYSAIRMCLVDSDIKVTTIERDEKRYKEAIKNIKLFNLEDRINIIFDDAFNVELNDSYDLIFIDAAKSQYIKFFEKFKLNLKDNGVILSDNLNFHGLTHTEKEIKSRNVRGIVRKLNNYIEFLKENKEFDTTFYEIGDGISISKRSK
ncbi:MAG: O-methyltransferase [Lactobacillales bacterium]|nr:O-methyltransferase [Lactobacillales bacterium]